MLSSWALPRRCFRITFIKSVLMAAMLLVVLNWFFFSQRAEFKHSFQSTLTGAYQSRTKLELLHERLQQTTDGFEVTKGTKDSIDIDAGNLEGKVFLVKKAEKRGKELFLKLVVYEDKNGGLGLTDAEEKSKGKPNVGYEGALEENKNLENENVLKFLPKYSKSYVKSSKSSSFVAPVETTTELDEFKKKGGDDNATVVPPTQNRHDYGNGRDERKSAVAASVVNEGDAKSNAKSSKINKLDKVKVDSKNIDTSLDGSRETNNLNKRQKSLVTQNVPDDDAEKQTETESPGDQSQVEIAVAKGTEEDEFEEQWENINDDALETPDKVKDVITHCPTNNLSQPGLPKYGKCQPHKPSLEACKTAYRLYNFNPVDIDFNEPYEGDICNIKVAEKKNKKRVIVRCNWNLCKREIIAKSMNPQNGQHDIVESFSTTRALQKALSRIVLSNLKNKHPYVILECEKKGVNQTVRQLLPINPELTIQETDVLRPKNTINVNIVLIDSVARAHFYRSLPKTIELFKDWSQDNRAPAKIFDFELFQAVEGHTAENTHALFTGKLFPPSKNRDAVRAVGMEHLFGAFRRAGYQTMWQEDLCWKGYWGLMTDLALGYSWEDLAKGLHKSFIDHTGITHSSCEVLRQYGLDTPFNGPSGDQICYNGKFQHSYYLNYTLDTIRAIRASPYAQPLLSYMSLNVGHDQEGRRIQTFDRALREYVNAIGREDDTITILLADHGNTYTDYTVSIMEGRFEMFHPSLFIIVPNNVAKTLGEKAINALRTNQRRLTTMIDIHHAVMALKGPISDGVRPVGMFGPISDTRTCDNVELRTPNLCVCEGWDSPTTNDTVKTALVEFAIGQLNNKVQQELVNSSHGSALSLMRSCQRLQAIRFYNVRERNSKSDGSLFTTIDISVLSGNVVSQAEDVFQVEVKSKIVPGQDSMDLQLIHYERISMFGQYKTCADKGINAKLCVCSRTNNRVSQTRRTIKKAVFQSTFQFCNSDTSYKRIQSCGCLYLVTRRHGSEGDAYGWEVANVCTNRMFAVTVEYGATRNMKMSSASPVIVTLPPGSVTFILSAMKSVTYYSGRVTVDVNIVRSRNVTVYN